MRCLHFWKQNYFEVELKLGCVSSSFSEDPNALQDPAKGSPASQYSSGAEEVLPSECIDTRRNC